MVQIAKGTFEVKLQPTPVAELAASASLAALTIDKRFAGDLVGTSQGQMMSVMTPTRGSAGYVALERVSGTLHNRRGSFVLQHSGIMNRGAPSLDVVVVPDSATEELAGLSGRLTIRIEGGQHFYEFEYSLPAGDTGKGTL